MSLSPGTRMGSYEIVARVAAVAAWSLYAILTSRPGTALRSAAQPLA